jgi:ketosteroid isomerase-like protein
MHANSIRAVYSAVDASDWTSLLELFHETIRYERPGHDPLVGRPRLFRFYSSERGIDRSEHRIEHVVVEGDAGACWGEVELEKGGALTTLPFADTFLFAEGKIAFRRTHFFRPLG